MVFIDTMLQKGHFSYQKYHLRKMVPNINGTSNKWHLTKAATHKKVISKLTLLVFWSTTNTLLIEPTATIRHKLEKHHFKIPLPWVWIIQQIQELFFRNNSNILANNLWAYFCKVCHFCKTESFVGAFVFVYLRWSTCHVPLL